METTRPGSGDHWLTPDVIAEAFQRFAREEAQAHARNQSPASSSSRVASPPGARLVPAPENPSHDGFRPASMSPDEVMTSVGHALLRESRTPSPVDTSTTIDRSSPRFHSTPSPPLPESMNLQSSIPTAPTDPDSPIPDLLAAAHKIQPRKARPQTRDALRSFSIAKAWEKLTGSPVSPTSDPNGQSAPRIVLPRTVDSPPSLPPLLASPPRVGGPPPPHQSPPPKSESPADPRLSYIPEDGAWAPQTLGPSAEEVSAAQRKRQSVSKYPTPLETPTIPPSLQLIEPTPLPDGQTLPQPQNRLLLRTRQKRRSYRRSHEFAPENRNWSPPRQPLDFGHHESTISRPPSRRGSQSSHGHDSGVEEGSMGTSYSYEVLKRHPSRPRHSHPVAQPVPGDRTLDDRLHDGRKAGWVSQLMEALTPGGGARPKSIRKAKRREGSESVNDTGERHTHPSPADDEVASSCCVVS